MLIVPKLRMPPLRAKMLPRDRLRHRLSEGSQSRLIFISGPAGSGKTSLACQWLTRHPFPSAWYALDEDDNDVDVFFRYFLTALAMVDRRLAVDVEPWIQGHNPLSAGEVMPDLIRHLSRVEQHVYVVLDDYHCIASGDIHGALQQLLFLTLPTIHFIVISRHALPFSITRMKVRNQVVEISARELRVGFEETAVFFKDIMSLSLNADQVRQVVGQMEGWLGGLQLCGMSLQGREPQVDVNEVLSRACRDAVDYLIDEVLDLQPEEVRRFLYATALLERFDEALGHLISGHADAEGFIERIYADNLFLIRLDEEGGWYRYHNLFARAVRRRAFEMDGERYRAACRTAALWFAEQGFVEDAFRQALVADDPVFAADLMEDIFLAVPEHVELAHCHRWLSRLPRELLVQRPLIRLQDARIRLQLAEISNIAEVLADIESRWDLVIERYEGPKRKLCEDYLFILKQILPYWHDPENVDIPALESALQQIPLAAGALSAFCSVLPFSHYYQGNPATADRSLKTIRKAVFNSGNRLSIMIWYRVAATVERLMGNLHRAEGVVYEALRMWGQGDDRHIPLRFMVDLPMAWICYQRDELEKTQAYAEAVLKFVEQTRFVYEIADVNYLLSLVYASGGDRRNADHCMQRMQWAAGVISTPGLITLAEARAARVALILGDVRQAEQWRNDRRLSLKESFSLRWVFECQVTAEIHIAQGRFQAAAKLLEPVRGRCHEHHMAEAVLEIDVLKAIVLYQLGEFANARRIMKRALLFARIRGYLRPFVDHIQWIPPMLAMVADEAADAEGAAFHSRVSDAIGMEWPPAATQGDADYRPLGTLTRRECDILAMLARGYKNREIAEKSFISLHTVKTHVKNIYEKLNVTTRVQAVRKGQELNLI